MLGGKKSPGAKAGAVGLEFVSAVVKAQNWRASLEGKSITHQGIKLLFQ
jgi:hypothetical protein